MALLRAPTQAHHARNRSGTTFFFWMSETGQESAGVFLETLGTLVCKRTITAGLYSGLRLVTSSHIRN